MSKINLALRLAELLIASEREQHDERMIHITDQLRSNLDNLQSILEEDQAELNDKRKNEYKQHELPIATEELPMVMKVLSVDELKK